MARLRSPVDVKNLLQPAVDFPKLTSCVDWWRYWQSLGVVLRGAAAATQNGSASSSGERVL